MIGDTYKGPALKAIINTPGLLWGAWLDTDHEIIAYTGINVPQALFEVDGETLVNTSEVDGGAAPASPETIVYFALVDDADSGVIVLAGPVSFDPAPDEGTPLVAAPGAIVLAWDEP